jgi:hypothetical protein
MSIDVSGVIVEKVTGTTGRGVRYENDFENASLSRFLK